MHYRSVGEPINSSTKASTSCKNVVNSGSATSEFKKEVCGIFAVTGPQFDDSRLFGMLAFRNGIEYYNFNFRALIEIYFCTSRRNLARFE